MSTNEDTAKTITLTGSDPDSNPLTFKVTSLPTNGVLHDGSTAGGTAILTTPSADSERGRRRIPGANYNGSDSFQFKANDGSGFDERRDGLDQRDLGQRRPGGHRQDGHDQRGHAYTFAAADFGFSDPERHARPTACRRSRSPRLPAAGTLTRQRRRRHRRRSSSPIADIDAGKLVFTPAANANGAGYASFTFQVQDDGGTANGGVDLDPSANTMTINVTLGQRRARRAPTRRSPRYEDTAYTFARRRLRLQRSQRHPGQRLRGGEDHARLPAAGTLTRQRRRGRPPATSSSLPTSPPASWCSRRRPTPTAPATPASPSRCRTTAAPPTAASTSTRRANTMTINVTSVNDAPAGTDKTVTTQRGHRLHLRAPPTSASPIPTTRPANALPAVKITTLPGRRHADATTASR